MPRNYRRGGALAGIMLMVLMLGALGIAALVATGLYIADHVSVTESDARGETTVETPFGTVRVRDHARLDPKHMGVPIYPGAVREHDSRKLASFHFDFGDVHKAFAISAAEYRTSDSAMSTKPSPYRRPNTAPPTRSIGSRISTATSFRTG